MLLPIPFSGIVAIRGGQVNILYMVLWPSTLVKYDKRFCNTNKWLLLSFWFDQSFCYDINTFKILFWHLAPSHYCVLYIDAYFIMDTQQKMYLDISLCALGAWYWKVKMAVLSGLNHWSSIVCFLCGKPGQRVTLPPLQNNLPPASHPLHPPPTLPRQMIHPAARQVLIQLALALIMLVMTDHQRSHCLRGCLDEWGCD